jgi:hypothetical protein
VFAKVRKWYSSTEMTHLAESKNNLAFFLEGPVRQITTFLKKNVKNTINSGIKKKYLTLWVSLQVALEHKPLRNLVQIATLAWSWI